MRGWRLSKKKYISTAFSGDGARLEGGRWNSKGNLMVYASSNLSLASLEQLARYGRVSSLLKNYMAIPFEFDESLLLELDRETLPDDWQSQPPTPSTQLIGDDWLQNMASVFLAVPSTVVTPDELNILVNPLHPDFTKIDIGEPVPIAFDPRLFK